MDDGNPINLPITNFAKEITTAVNNHPVVLITAETGAGKSTQVPKYLLQAGYRMVITQPRRLAARTVAARVAAELGEELGQTIGVRTRDDKIDSNSTRCLFATDGLALVRELVGVSGHNLLVIDEVHEWNLNIEVLVAWTKLQLERGANFKVVLMSATLEAQRLSAYFNNAPIIKVPGRLFPVEERHPTRNLVEDVAGLLREGRNVLVFQPGKKEIGETIEDLQKMGVNAEILPLHGELTPEDQARCFQPYYRPKCVVATNVAQTSVTIPDIDAVVDSGMERRTELVDGVEGLYLKSISLADSEQRKGRAGRTKPGIYIDHCGESDRLDFPKAEILRTRLDQTVLRLAEAGFDAEELSFFHQPDRRAIHDAKRALTALGCLDLEGHVTRKGSRVATMPISVEMACMVIEAEKRRVVEDILTIAAIMEVGGITTNRDEKGKESIAWMLLCRGETGSDALAQLLVYRAASSMSAQEMRKHCIHSKNYFEAKKVRRHLEESLRGKVHDFQSTGNREDILKSVCAGMVDHLYHFNFGTYLNGDQVPRKLNRHSVVGFPAPEWIVGEPWDLQVPGKYGPITLNLVRMATKVDPLWLVEVAPQLVERKTGLNLRYDADKDMLVSTTEVYFNGVKVAEETVDHPEADCSVWRLELEEKRRREEERVGLLGRANDLRDQITRIYWDNQNKLMQHSMELSTALYRRTYEALPETTNALRSWIVASEELLTRANGVINPAPIKKVVQAPVSVPHQPADLSKANLGDLFGGGAKVSSKRK